MPLHLLRETIMSYASMKEDEAHSEATDTDRVLDKVEKESKPKRVASRFFNALLALFFFILFVLSLVSFSAFSNRYRQVRSHSNGGGNCILGASFDSSNTMIVLEDDGSCRLAIGGEVVIAMYAILSIVVMVIKIIGGWSILSCFLIFELITCVIMALLSFSTSVVISVGISLTCSQVETAFPHQRCPDYLYPVIGGSRFYRDIEVAQVAAWLGFGIIVLILVFYILCIIMYGYGRRQAKLARQSALSESRGPTHPKKAYEIIKS